MADAPLARSTAPHAGMPALDASAESTSWFEFAPTSLFYAPVYSYVAWLALRHRGLRHPINSNPAIPFSGLVGESKSAVLNEVSGTSRHLVAPYRAVLRWSGDGGVARTLQDAETAMADANLDFPLVVKPDLGMRGAGVQVARSRDDLAAYIQAFPAGGRFLVQELIDEEGEAGIFYVRHPDWEKGRIISVTLKYFPRVVGTGDHTLRQLIFNDPRAGKLAHLYLDRFRNRLDTTVPKGQSVRLAFAGNHCRGTIFRNGTDNVTPAMENAFDQIARDMGEFYVGRFDVRFGDFDALKAGRDFRIIEVNGAGGEATHIWDSRMTLLGAYKSLFNQFGHIFAIGAKNRKRGFKPAPLKAFFAAMQEEKRLTDDYPITH